MNSKNNRVEKCNGTPQGINIRGQDEILKERTGKRNKRSEELKYRVSKIVKANIVKRKSEPTEGEFKRLIDKDFLKYSKQVDVVTEIESLQEPLDCIVLY